MGDVCESDFDGDGVSNSADHCAVDPAVGLFSVSPPSEHLLDPTLVNYTAPTWEVTHGGREVRLRGHTEMAVMLLGQ